MEDRIKDIVATFLRVPAAQIGPDTRVDRQALQSSILLHRMYARLEEQGFRFENYTGIQVFGDLLRQQQMTGQPASVAGAAVTEPSAAVRDLSEDAGFIGIDIQDTKALPRTNDFRGDSFYRMNFTPAEISYCILQPDPYASFGGLFAAKEAIIKADGTRRSMNFNSLEIGHTTEGAPFTSDFRLSISHAGGFAVAVAVSERSLSTGGHVAPPALALPAARTGRANYPAWIALLLALLSIIIVLWRQKATI
jgi:phosphopantetheine--protein transferase-like protein